MSESTIDRLVSRFETGIAAATLVGVLALGVLRALVIAVLLSIVDVVRRSAQPSRRGARLGGSAWPLRKRSAPPVGADHSRRRGVSARRSAVLRERALRARSALEAIRGAPKPARWLVFDAEAMAHVDATGADGPRDLAADLSRDGIGLVVARIKPQVYARLAAAGVHEAIGID